MVDVSMGIGEVVEDWTGDARFFEYSEAADPIGSGATSPIPAIAFPADLYATGPSRVVPLDLSAALRTPYPATSPALLASFVRIEAGDELRLAPNATSQLLYYTLLGDQVDRATGQIVDPTRVDWEPGGAFVTPPGKWHSHHNDSGADAHLIPIQDAGLQTYLRSLDIRFSAPA